MDTRILEILNDELDRQHSTVELIASENFASPSVMDLAGSVFTNKYAEGYPGKRYYGGEVIAACAWASGPRGRGAY